jgi:hypothetical protein
MITHEKMVGVRSSRRSKVARAAKDDDARVNRVSRIFWIALGCCSLLGAKPAASESKASKERRGCANAYKGAEHLEAAGHLLQARELFATCAKASCGAFLRSRCAARYAQLEADSPTIVPVITDDATSVSLDARVTIDGQLLTAHLDGRAYPVDPGLHHISFSTENGVTVTRAVLIAQGERNRLIEVPLHSERGAKATLDKTSVESAPRERSSESARPEVSTSTPPATSAASITPLPEPPPLDTHSSSGGGSAAPYLLGGLTLAGAGGYALFTYWGNQDNKSLSACAPNCAQASVDHIRKMYLVADASLAVGAIAALGLVTWAAVSPSGPSDRPPSRAAVVDVTPLPSGAFARVSGSF